MCILCVYIVIIIYIGSETHPKYVENPVIPGHEFIGEVVKLGPGMCLEECYVHHNIVSQTCVYG